MATIRKLPSGKWNVQVRSGGKLIDSSTHATRQAALSCNLYSLNAGQAAIIDMADAMTDTTGNLPVLSGIYPDMAAPVVRNTIDGRELTMMRWGMPSPASALINKRTDSGLTNIRNTKSPHWRRWYGLEHRCVVPFTSFAEYQHQMGQAPVQPGLP